jgi:HEAT repeat protein
MESDVKPENAAPSQTGPADRPRRRAVRRFVFAFLAVLFITGGVLWMLSCREPHYRGLSLSAWLKKYDDAFDAEPQRAEAADAVRQIGPSAIPSLLRWAGASDSKLRQRLEEWSAKQSLIQSTFTPADEYHKRAIERFSLIGLQGKSAIPDLQKLLCKPDTAYTAAQILCLFGPDAAPILQNGLTDRTPKIRSATAYAIRHYQPEISSLEIRPPVPMLLNLLQDSQSDVRVLAVYSIGKAAARNDVRPEVAVHLLIQQLKGADARCRHESISAIISLGPSGRIAISELLETLIGWAAEPTRIQDCGYIVRLLQTLHAEPSQVKSCIPTLLQSAAGTNTDLRASIFQLLEKIDLEISRTNLSLLDIDYRDSTLISSEITSLQSWEPFDRRVAAYRLGKFGAAAESAMPALLKATKDEDEKVRAAAREALKSIDPEAARKAGVE